MTLLALITLYHRLLQYLILDCELSEGKNLFCSAFCIYVLTQCLKKWHLSLKVWMRLITFDYMITPSYLSCFFTSHLRCYSLLVSLLHLLAILSSLNGSALTPSLTFLSFDFKMPPRS